MSYTGNMNPSTGKTGSKGMLLTATNTPTKKAILSVHSTEHPAPRVHTETKQDVWMAPMPYDVTIQRVGRAVTSQEQINK